MSNARTEYGDIIDRPHHISEKHPQMSRINRAAQFAPFAALTGYDDLIRESARETETRQIPDENKIEEMNDKLVFLFQQEPADARGGHDGHQHRRAGQGERADGQAAGVLED